MFGAQKPQPPPSRGRINLPNLKEHPDQGCLPDNVRPSARKPTARRRATFRCTPIPILPTVWASNSRAPNTTQFGPCWKTTALEAQMLWQQESGDFDLINDMVCMSLPELSRAMDRSKTGMPALDPSTALTQTPSYQQPSSGFAAGYGGATSGMSGGFYPPDLQGGNQRGPRGRSTQLPRPETCFNNPSQRRRLSGRQDALAVTTRSALFRCGSSTGNQSL